MITYALKFSSLSKVRKEQLDSFLLNGHTSESYHNLHNLKGTMLPYSYARVDEKHFGPLFSKYCRRVQEIVFICLNAPSPPYLALVFWRCQDIFFNELERSREGPQ